MWGRGRGRESRVRSWGAVLGACCCVADGDGGIDGCAGENEYKED